MHSSRLFKLTSLSKVFAPKFKTIYWKIFNFTSEYYGWTLFSFIVVEQSVQLRSIIYISYSFKFPNRLGKIKVNFFVESFLRNLIHLIHLVKIVNSQGKNFKYLPKSGNNLKNRNKSGNFGFFTRFIYLLNPPMFGYVFFQILA